MALKKRNTGPKEKKYIQEKEREFLAYYDAHADAIFRHVYVRIRDRDIAKDIVQESFAKTWDYLAKGKEIRYLRAFIYRVANNLIVDTVRRRHTSSLDSMVEDDGFEAVDENTTHPGEIGDARKAMLLLSQLDPMYRVVVTMRFVDGLSPQEISHALGISENLISVRIHRAVERLRVLMHKTVLGD